MDSADCVSTRPTIAVYSAVIGGGTPVTEFVQILNRNRYVARADGGHYRGPVLAQASTNVSTHRAATWAFGWVGSGAVA